MSGQQSTLFPGLQWKGEGQSYTLQLALPLSSAKQCFKKRIKIIIIKCILQYIIIDLFQTLLYDYNKFSRVEAGTRQTSLLYISGTNHVIVA